MSNSSELCKNEQLFVADMSSFLLVNNTDKDILILGKGLKDELDDATLTAEKKYSIDFREHKKTLFKISL